MIDETQARILSKHDEEILDNKTRYKEKSDIEGLLLTPSFDIVTNGKFALFQKSC